MNMAKRSTSVHTTLHLHHHPPHLHHLLLCLLLLLLQNLYQVDSFATFQYVCIVYDPLLVQTTEVTQGSGDGEGNATLHLIEYLGHKPITIDNANDTSQWINALNDCKVLIFPQVGEPLWVSNVTELIGNETVQLIRSWTEAGGMFIELGSYFVGATHQIFGGSRVLNSRVSAAANRTARGTELSNNSSSPFYGIASSFGYVSSVALYQTGTVPPDECLLEASLPGQFCIARYKPFGEGHVIILGYDFSRVIPRGTQDGGWPALLDRLIRFGGSSNNMTLQVVNSDPATGIGLALMGNSPNFVLFPLEGDGPEDEYASCEFGEIVRYYSSGVERDRARFPEEWNMTSDTSAGDGSVMYRFEATVLNMTVTIQILQSNNTENFAFAGVNFATDPATVKWTIEFEHQQSNSGGDWEGSFELLIPIMSSSAVTSVLREDDVPSQGLTTYTLRYDNDDAAEPFDSYVGVVDLAIIDDIVTPITHSIMITDAAQSYGILSLRMPSFGSSFAYDPSFSILLDPDNIQDSESDGDSNDRTLLIVLTTAITIPVLGGVVLLLVTAFVLIYLRVWFYNRFRRGVGSVNFALEDAPNTESGSQGNEV